MKMLAMVLLSLGAIFAQAEPPLKTDDQLVKEMGDDDFVVREQANKTLEDRGDAAILALRAGLKSDDAEIAYRCRTLIGKIEKPIWDKLVKRSVDMSVSVICIGADGRFNCVISGTIVKSTKDKSYILSCALCAISDDGKAKVKYDGKTYDAEIVKVDAEKALFLLSIDKGDLPAAKIADNEVVGPVCQAGCREDKKPNVREGNAYDYSHNIRYAITCVYGDLGAGIYTMDKNYNLRLVAVLWGSDGEFCNDCVVPLGTIKSFLKDCFK